MNTKILALLLAFSTTLPLLAAEIPSKEDLETLVAETLMSFNDGVQNDDFGDFRSTMAKPAQEQISAERLKTSFHEFVEKKLNISSIENLDPTFDSKEIDKEGLLNVAGSYPTTPVVVRFRLRYLHEEGEWKLFGINIDTKTESPDAQKKESD